MLSLGRVRYSYDGAKATLLRTWYFGKRSSYIRAIDVNGHVPDLSIIMRHPHGYCRTALTDYPTYKMERVLIRLTLGLRSFYVAPPPLLSFQIGYGHIRNLYGSYIGLLLPILNKLFV